MSELNERYRDTWEASKSLRRSYPSNPDQQFAEADLGHDPNAAAGCR